jgi:ADP-heptose:LPS heptosyltransferase
VTKPKVLLFHSGALGDLLVSTQSLWRLYYALDPAEVIILGNKVWLDLLPVLELPQCFNTVWLLEKHTGPKQYTTLIKKHGFTHFITLRSESTRCLWTAWRCGIPIRVGSGGILHRIFLNSFTPMPPKTIHEIQRYNYQVKPVISWQDWDLPFVELIGNQMIKPAQDTVTHQVPIHIVINPTASNRFKVWKSHRFLELALLLYAHFPNIQISFVGAIHEEFWLQEASGGFFPYHMPPTLIELKKNLQSATVFVTNASSLQFMASFLHVPTVTIMGLAHNPIWGPKDPLELSKAPTLFIQNKSYAYPHVIQKTMLNPLERIYYDAVSVSQVYAGILQLLQPTIQIH